MASYVTDNFMWSPPAVGQDSLSKDVWYAQMQVFMSTFNDITFTNPLWRKGVDMDNNLDGSVRVYGLWNSKFASSGKTGLLKYYCTFDFDKDGKIVHYSPYNGKVLPGYMFAGTGFWDTFRALYPFLNLILLPGQQSYWYCQVILGYR